MNTTPSTAYFLTPTKRYGWKLTNMQEERTNDIPADVIPISAISSCNFQMNIAHTFHPPPEHIIRKWEEYITTLPKYTQLMLKSTLVHKSTQFHNIMDTGEELIICSDGALKDRNSGGTFVISSLKEEILVTIRIQTRDITTSNHHIGQRLKRAIVHSFLSSITANFIT